MTEFAVMPGNIIISCSGTMGCAFLLPLNAPAGIINQALLKVTPDKQRVIGRYIELILSGDPIQQQYFRNNSGATIQNVSSMNIMKSIPIPLPSIQVQEKIVECIESEIALVGANRKLVEIFEKKIQDKLAEIWGEGN
ncbi:MAG TPA: restriction endonuclease subunit S [Candidatus Wunengus sp. YC65]|uniref:restriction endonuclease subunit S n=1 Tax=Candidatus Wunengus sp. YC65 TaxID=3367701 RepID=UPI00402910E6